MLSRSRGSGLIWLGLSVFIVAIDQLSKWWINAHLVWGQVYPLLPFLNVRLAYNPGAAFSFLGDASGWQRSVLSVVTGIVVVVLTQWLRRSGRGSTWMGLSLSLIIGGAVGNLIDRIHLGYVIDFIDFHVNTWHFATFNVADAAISVGALLLLLKLVINAESSSSKD